MKRLSPIPMVALALLFQPICGAQRLAPPEKLATPPGADISEMTHFNGKVYFNAYDSMHGNELWETDGSESGTKMIDDVAPGVYGSLPGAYSEFNGELYFVAGKQSARSGGLSLGCLYRMTKEGKIVEAPQAIKESGETNTISLARKLWVWGNRLIFTGETIHGSSLFSTDGISDSPELLWCDEQGKPLPTQCFVQDLRTTENALFMVDKNGEVWARARDRKGMFRVLNTPHTELATAIGTLGDRLFFGLISENTGKELFIASAEPNSARMIKERPGVSGSFEAEGAISSIKLGDRLFFGANDGEHGRELFVSDGTTEGTHMLMDINQGPKSSNPDWFYSLGSRFLFVADDGQHGTELWISNGTAEGTQLLADLMPGGESNYIHNYVSTSDRVFFTANSPATGTENFVTDGTREGTRLFTEVVSGSKGSDPAQNEVSDRYLIFTADDGVHGRQLWRADLETGTAQLIKIIGPTEDTPSSQPVGPLVPVGDNVYFASDSPATGVELWSLPQGETAPHLVYDIFPGPAGSHPEHLVGVGNDLFFLAESRENKINLWRFDTAQEDATPVAVETEGLEQFDNLTGFKDMLLLTATHPEYGNELWALRPSYERLELVKDVLAGKSGSDPERLTVTPSGVMFIANDENRMRILWITDGADGGTHSIATFPGHGAPLTP